MFGYRTPAIFIILLVSFSSVALGGKLGGIRSKAREPSPAPVRRDEPSQEPAPSPPVRSPRQETNSGSNNRQEQRAEEPPRPRRSSSTNKLAEVRARAHGPVAVASRPQPRRHRRNHQHQNPRRRDYRRSAPAFHFRTAFDSCGPVQPRPTTIVEQHHYYALEPAVVGTPVIAPTPALPPVMPVEPTVVQNIIAEPACGPTDNNEFYVSDHAPSHASDLAFLVASPDSLAPIHVRFEIDYAADEDDVTRMGFGLLANVTGSLGIDTGVRLFREQNDDVRDHMWIGDVNVVYELFPTEFIRTRAGIGASFLADHYGAEAGLNLTVGTDVFAGPVTLTGEADFGTIGDTDLFHARATAAVRMGEHVETFLGYDYLDIGGVKIHGMLAGLRFRY